MFEAAVHKSAPSHSELVAAYAGYLRRRAYKPGVIDAFVHAVEHFLSWLADEAIAVSQVQESIVERFTKEHLPACRCPGRLQRNNVTMRAALRHLLRPLRADGVIAAKVQTYPLAIRDEIEAFTNHLRQVCGLAANTVVSRRQWVGRFLAHQFLHESIDVAALGPNDPHDFVKTQCVGFQPGTVGVVGNALRSYLRFRAVQHGDAVDRLLAAVPTVAQWPLATIPKHLSADEVERWLNACDRRSPQGKRDYAMARCLADLGLRTCEVAALGLDDLHWVAGTITIDAGKSRRADTLPLPVLTGRAIAEYLRTGRPQSSSRQLFVRHQAPFDEPVSSVLVRGAMRRASARCGLTERCSGPHVLRHTLATRLLGGGASLKEIADLLRHRSLDTTAIYAKVDVVRLFRLAPPWPGGAQ